MTKILQLIYEVIIRPVSVFRKIKDENLLKEAIIIYLLVNIFSVFIPGWQILRFNQKNVLSDIISFSQYQIIKIAISFITIIFIIFLADLVSKKIGGKRESLKLFIGFLLISAVTEILHVIVTYIPDITFSPNKIVPNGVATLWYLILLYILIQEIYKYSKVKTLLVFLTIVISFLSINYFIGLYGINAYILNLL